MKPSTEPVMYTAYALTLIGAIIGLLHTFNVWSPTPDQVTAITVAFTALVPFLGLLLRSRVSPVTSSNPASTFVPPVV